MSYVAVATVTCQLNVQQPGLAVATVICHCGQLKMQQPGPCIDSRRERDWKCPITILVDACHGHKMV